MSPRLIKQLLHGSPFVRFTLRLTFQRPADFCSKKFFASALTVMGGNGNFRVVLRFRGATADRVAEREWHETQALRWLAGRRLELTMVLGSLAEVERWVMSWGPDVEVVEPAELRQSVRKIALAIARNHPRDGSRQND